MIKIYFWCPYLSHVATIKNVINSAISLSKYNPSYSVSLIDNFGEWDFHKKKLATNNIKIEKLTNFKIKKDKTGFFRSRLYLVYLFIKSFFPLLKILKNKKPDFIIIHLLTSLPLIILLLFNLKTRFILRISGLPKLNFFRKFLWKLIAKKIYAVSCPSQQTLTDLDGLKIFDSNKLKILYDPIIEVSLIHNKKKVLSKINDKNYFLNIGRLTKQKNQKLLIDLFYELTKKNNELILYIIGDGEKKVELEKKIKKLDLQKKIILLGHKNNVFPYIKRARAVISTSLWEDPGAVMVESAFCNTPIISSNCPNGPTEFLSYDKGGYLFENNNLTSLKKKINEFLNDTEQSVLSKKIFAKFNSKKYTCFRHYNQFQKILND